VKRLASVGYEGELDKNERGAAARTLGSAGAAVTSWSRAPIALRVVPDAPRMLEPLLACLSGPGRPAGVIEARRDDDAVVLKIDAERTPLALVLAIIDTELEGAPGRTIEAMQPLDDATLTALAGALLGEPGIDASRLIETHLEPLLGATS
jgi:hypothetical protein